MTSCAAVNVKIIAPGLEGVMKVKGESINMSETVCQEKNVNEIVRAFRIPKGKLFTLERRINHRLCR